MTASYLAHWMKTHEPALQIKLRVENAKDSFEHLRSGHTDLAIITDPPIHSQFHYQPIIEDTLVAALSPLRKAATFPDFAMVTLAKSTLLLREETSRTRSFIFRILDQMGIVPKDIQELHTPETIREAIALNMGIGIFFSVECPPDPRLLYKPIRSDFALPTSSTFLVTPTDRRNLPLIKMTREWVSHFHDSPQVPI